MLIAVGAALGGAVRETDTVARLGGDEFAVLAAISVSFSGEQLAERLRAAVATVGAPAGVTASVGVAEVEPGDDVEDLHAPGRRGDVPRRSRPAATGSPASRSESRRRRSRRVARRVAGYSLRHTGRPLTAACDAAVTVR